MPIGDDIIISPKGGDLGWRRIKGCVVPYSAALGVGQYFSNLIRKRIHKQKPCNIVFTGEAGVSKSYSAIALARFIDPSFSIRNVVMTYSEFMEAMTTFGEGELVVFDEPEYEFGHREWYRSQNRALVATMRSGRFKVHPVFIPCINKRLLDKVVRENLLQFMVHFTDRGEAKVYTIMPSRFDERVWYDPLCSLKIEMLDVSKCQKSWCYSCKDFDSCPLLRAQYERKRKKIQDQRYVQDLERAKKEEEKQMTFEQWLSKAYENLEDFYYTTAKGQKRLSTEKIQLILGCSQTMAQRIRQTLKAMTKEEVRQLILKRLGLDALV